MTHLITSPPPPSFAPAPEAVVFPPEEDDDHSVDLSGHCGHSVRLVLGDHWTPPFWRWRYGPARGGSIGHGRGPLPPFAPRPCVPTPPAWE